MLTIELTGTDTASGMGVSVTHKVSPVGKLARKLVDMGHDEKQQVAVIRGDTECFNRMPLGSWARITTIENDRTSARHAAYVPFFATAVGHTAQTQG